VSLRHILTEVFLWIGVGLVLCGALGVVVMRDAFDRLHFPAVASLGALFVAIAVVIEKSFSLVGDESLLAAVFLVVVSPIVTHAIARGIRISERGDWRLGDDEGIEIEEPDR
jgi:monovalent cation/proton antiporter MnhG/PhaG subunit